MAENKLNAILGDSFADLEIHLLSYLGGWPDNLLEAEFEQITDETYSLALSAANILNSTCDITVYIVQKTENDFTFAITAQPPTQNFAGFFPQMIPFDTYGIFDITTLSAPNLLETEIADIKWLYVYYACADESQEVNLKNDFQQQISAFLFSDKTGEEVVETLSDISVGDEGLSEATTWQGGFYHFGNLAEMPFDDILPAGDAWSFLEGTMDVQGCVYFDGIEAFLSLQLPLLEINYPFGDGDDAVVEGISLTAEISAPLLLSEEANYSETETVSADRYIGLIGLIKFAGDNQLNISGHWPLDNDDIVFSVGCQLADIGFDDSNFPAGLSFPEEIDIEAEFTISKENATLKKIGFEVTLFDWQIVENIFSLDELNFAIEIYHPGTLNTTMASFEALALIGGDSGIHLICSGNYPSGDFYLGLNPEYPITFDSLISAFIDLGEDSVSDLAITELSGAFNYNTNYIAVHATIASESEWDPNPDLGFKLNSIQLAVDGFSSDFNFNISAEFNYDNLAFEIGALYSSSGWNFSAALVGEVSLSDLGSAFGFSDVPDELNNFFLTSLDLSFNTGSSTFHFGGSGKYAFEDTEVDLFLDIDISGSEVAFAGSFSYILDVDEPEEVIDFKVDFVKSGTSYNAEFSLVFPVGDLNIYLEAELSQSVSDDDKVTEATFNGGASNVDLHITDLLTDLLQEVFPDFEDSLGYLIPNITIEDIYVAYDGAEKETNFLAVSEVNGQDVNVFFQYKSGTNGHYAFGLLTSLTDLGGLPLVGEQMKDVGLLNLGFVYASKLGTFRFPEITEVDGVNKLSVTDSNKDFGKGLNMMGELDYATFDNPFSLVLVTGSESEASTSTESVSTESSVPIATGSVSTTEDESTSETDVTWIELKKDIGPLRIEAIGFSYVEEIITLLFSGSVSLSGLTVSLEGLGMSFNLPELLDGKIGVPDFTIDGMGIGYKCDPVEISGAFLATESDTGVPVYSGTAVLKAESFTLSALGSYTTINNAPSMFLFALYEGTIGGPAFFFVEGLAVGFGYNRRVIIPEVTEVENFPLVEMAIEPSATQANNAQSLTAILTDLDDYIEPSDGDYWLAVGVKFNSFKLIDSFALMIASFGETEDFRLDILGVSTLVFPPQDAASKVPIIAQIRMAFQASLIPSEGFLGVKAQLLEGSYIISKDCVLTGGYAFYSWFDGDHAGDFVQTMGGYHPDFSVPDHYPTVPRLGLNWTVSSTVTIKGEMYYAMTPTMCMAGGLLDATYKDGSLKAWFNMSADFLICWQPFYYDAQFHVNFGVEYKEDCGLFDITVSVDIGADVHFWGPEFAGTARLDLDIFTVSISFGSDDDPDRTYISWSEFQSSFLPDVNPGVFVNNGLLKTEEVDNVDGVDGTDKDKRSIWVINPKDIQISTDSIFPINHGEIKSDSEDSDELITEIIAGGNDFGIDSMGLVNNDIVSYQKIEIFDDGMAKGDSSNTASLFKFTPVYKNIPKALWQEASGSAGNVSVSETEGTVDNVLTGFTITPAKSPDPGNTKAIYKDVLSLDITLNEEKFEFPDEPVAELEANEELPDFTDPTTNETVQNLMEQFGFSNDDFDVDGLDEDCFLNAPLREIVADETELETA